MNINVLVLNHFGPATPSRPQEMKQSLRDKWAEISRRVAPTPEGESVTDLVERHGVWTAPTRTVAGALQPRRRQRSAFLTYNSKGSLNRPFQEKGLFVQVEA